MTFLFERAVNRGGFLTDIYMKIVNRLMDLSDKMRERRKPKKLNALGQRQLMINEVVESLHCDCGGKCATCSHIIDDVVPYD